MIQLFKPKRNMRVTCTIRQQLGVRVRQIFTKLKSRDIKRYQPINIQKFPVMSQPPFSRKLIWNCQKDGCIEKFVAVWQGAMPKVEPTPTIRNDCGKKKEWMRNKLRKIEWCNSQFRTAQESWHDLTKEKIVESKAAKAIQKYVDECYPIYWARFFQPFMKLIGQKTRIFAFSGVIHA